MSTATVVNAGAAGGHFGYRVSVVNIGTGACVLSSPPQVWGTDVTKAQPITLDPGTGTYFDPAGGRTPRLESGRSAELTIVGSSGCNGGQGIHSYRLSQVSVAGRRDSLGDVELQSSCPLDLGPWIKPA